jgi:hypothetical protein
MGVVPNGGNDVRVGTGRANSIRECALTIVNTGSPFAVGSARTRPAARYPGTRNRSARFPRPRLRPGSWMARYDAFVDAAAAEPGWTTVS